MKAHFTKQCNLQLKIAKSWINFKAKGADKMTKGNALARLERLEPNYSLFLKTHNKIINLEDLDTSHNY